MDLVLTSSFGYEEEQIRPFILSLRQHYQGEVVVVTDQNLPIYSVYDCIPYLVQDSERGIQIDRYYHYRNCLRAAHCDRAFLTDIRDVVFQASPFALPSIARLEFFLENEIIKNSAPNAAWVRDLYGKEKLGHIQENYIACSGTTRGTYQGALAYVEYMTEELDQLHEEGKKSASGYDQGVHNYLLYTGFFPGSVLYPTGRGAVRTLSYDSVLHFSRDGLLLNNDDDVVPVVHQYDRLAQSLQNVFLERALR